MWLPLKEPKDVSARMWLVTQCFLVKNDNVTKPKRELGPREVFRIYLIFNSGAKGYGFWAVFVRNEIKFELHAHSGLEMEMV